MRQIPILLLALFLLSCNSGEHRGPSYAPRMEKDMAERTTDQATTTSPEPGEPRPKKIVRNADIAIRVSDLRESMTKLTAIAQQAGGFVSHSSTQQYDE